MLSARVLTMAGATIRIDLIEGTPHGPRTIEKSNWTGKAFDFARVDWLKMKSRPDSDGPRCDQPGQSIAATSSAAVMPRRMLRSAARNVSGSRANHSAVRSSGSTRSTSSMPARW